MSDGLAEISICAFMGPETSPIQRAQEAGYFADEGLKIHCEAAPGSIHQMIGLIDGDYNMAMTAVDNVIAYDENQGGATPEHPADLIVLLGCATDPRPLIARPEISDFAGLGGARIAVDAVNTGFSFLLRQWLEDQGLALEDYQLIPVGAVKARWDAVRSGDCAAGLLGKADAATAVQEGYTWLQSDPDPWDNYQGGVFTADRTWARQNRAALQGFKRALLKAVDWVLAPENADDLPDLLIRHLSHLSLSSTDAIQAAMELQSPQSILKPGLPINQDGFRVVMELRQKYGTPPVTLGGVDKYLDLI